MFQSIEPTNNYKDIDTAHQKLATFFFNKEPNLGPLIRWLMASYFGIQILLARAPQV